MVEADKSEVAKDRLRVSFRGKVLLAAFVVLLAFWMIVGIVVVSLTSRPRERASSRDANSLRGGLHANSVGGARRR